MKNIRIAKIMSRVAARLSALPGKSDYGAITAVLGYYGTARKLFKVSAGSFIPAPKVDSAVVRIDLYDIPKYQPKNEKFFRDLIKAAFEMRSADALKSMGLDENIRGERLSTREYVTLSDLLL